jgi:hypothetical protein
MMPSNWRAKDREQTGASLPEKALDHQAMLKLSAAEVEPSPQLRARVLGSFEKRMQRKHSALAWLVPATAAVMVVVVIALGYWKLRVPQPPTPQPIAKKVSTEVPPIAAAPKIQAGHVRSTGAARLRSQRRQPERLQAKRPAVRQDLPIAQFDSLLYCDAFTCGDAMQVIRLEMPAANVGRAYRPLARNGFVSADVIVGADGLTRAVRFTK